MANLEANLDFSQEDITIAQDQHLLDKLSEARSRLRQLLGSYQRGRMLKSGYRVAIIGAPNVGKSSLLNALLGEDRAIVTDVPGTTRDVVLGELSIAGVAVQFLDTAGIRQTEDLVESVGIRKSHEVAGQADLVWHLVDATSGDEVPSLPTTLVTSGKVQVVLNKVDLVDLEQLSKVHGEDALFISARTGFGIDGLIRELEGELQGETDDTAPAVMQGRQVELLERAEEYVGRGFELLQSQSSPEFVLSEIQEALFAIMEISGKRFDDEVMDRVFREFCLGK